MTDPNTWYCAHCGQQNASSFCTNCGASRPAAPAAVSQTQPVNPEMGGYAPQGAPQQPYSQTAQQPYQQQPYGQQPAAQPYQQPYGQPYQQPAPQYPAPMQQVAQSTSAFPGWKTSAGFAVIGLIAASLASSAAATISDNAILWYLIAYCIACIFYCLKVYPSCFTESPMLTDHRPVNVLNFFVGGLIFGCLWNHNLTRGKKGISNIVFTVFCVLSIIGCAFGLTTVHDGVVDTETPSSTAIQAITSDDDADKNDQPAEEVDLTAPVRQAAERDLDMIKNCDQEFINQVIDEETANSFSELGMSATDFMTAYLSGFDYEISSIFVDGDAATVEVAFTCKTYDQLEEAAESATSTLLEDPDVYNYSEEELTAKIGELLMAEMQAKEPVKGEYFTLTYVKIDGVWTIEDTQANTDAISNHLMVSPAE